MDTHQPYRPCPACQAVERTRIEAFSPDEWEVASCDACGFVYLTNPPPYEALEEEHAWEVSHFKRLEKRGGSTPLSGLNRSLRAKFKLNKGRRGQEDFVRWFGPGRVLDIGCGDGRRIGPPMTPYGIELSNALHARADAKFRSEGGHCLHAPGAEGLDAFADDFFDGVLMFSYLEHEVQVEKTLTGVHRVLKPGGRAFIRVPNYGSINRRVLGARWCGFRWPDHVNYFTLPSLKVLADRLGFSLTLVNRLSLPVDDNVHVLLEK